MAEWRTTTLGELGAHFATGPFGSDVSSKHFRASGVPMLRGSNLSSDVGTRLNEDDLVFLAEDALGRFSRSVAERGDLVFTCWGTVGQVGLVDTCSVHERYVISNKQMLLRPDIAIADPRYLYYNLSQPSMIDLVVSQAIGSSVPGFNLGQLKALPVRVHGLLEQRAIAEVLGALDDKIAANNRLATTVDELAAAVLRVSLSRDTAPLAELASITMGSSPPGSSYNEVGTGTPFFQGVRDFDVRSPRSRVWTTAPVRLAQRGDTLLSVRAPVGQVNVAATELCIGRGLASVRSIDGRPWSLFHLLRDAPEVWAPYEAEGTVFGSINRDQLAGLMLPTVTTSDETKVEESLAALEARLGTALDENRTLAATRDALLPALMSGALRVRDAERLAEHLT